MSLLHYPYLPYVALAAAQTTQFEMPPELLNLGAVGIMAVVMLVLVRALQPLMSALAAATKQLGDAATDAIKQQTKTTEVIQKNSETLDDLKSYMQEQTAAMTALKQSIQTQHSAELAELTDIRKGIADSVGNSESRIIQAQTEALKPIATALTEIRDELRTRNQRDDGVASRLDTVIRQLELLPKLATTELPAVVAPPAATSDHDERQAAQLTALQDALDRKRQSGELPKAEPEPPPAKDDPSA